MPRRQVGILDNAQARGLITFPEAERIARLLRSQVPSLRQVLTAPALALPGTPAPVPGASADDPALIQYTSGSTGAPKGVLLSHANILANIRAVGEVLSIGPADVVVSWLPLYHDMGLIGSWLGEVEEIVGAIPGIRKGCVAAFGVHDPAIGTERLVVIAESRETDQARRSQLQADVLDRVVAALGSPADTVVIGLPGSVLKTSSGKIRRSATKDAYLSGALARGRPSARAQWIRLFASDLRARLGRATRRGKDLLLGGYLGCLLLLTMPALWALVLLAPSARAADRLVRLWCRVMLALAGCDIRLEGQEHLAGTEPAVLAANHGSYLDAVALLAALPEDFRFVAKHELLRAPLVGSVIRKAGHLTVERAARAQSVADAERVTAALRRGMSVMVFPEGTFVRSPGILPFRLGAFKSAVETGRPVIPVTIRGTRDILPADEWLPRPGPVTVAVSPPLRSRGSSWPDIVSLRDEARAEIARRSGERLVGTRVIGSSPT
jgi:1-acyl-sn-glycerol-3-phosphate acyltransferase